MNIQISAFDLNNLLKRCKYLKTISLVESRRKSLSLTLKDYPEME